MSPVFWKLAMGTLMVPVMGFASATVSEKVDAVAIKATGVAVTVERAVKRGLSAAASGVERGTQAASKAVNKGADKLGILEKDETDVQGASEPKQ